jgi:hypothetical protein
VLISLANGTYNFMEHFTKKNVCVSVICVSECGRMSQSARVCIACAIINKSRK